MLFTSDRGITPADAAKAAEVISLIEADGWYLVPTKKGRVTVPGNTGDELKPGTLNNILKQAGLK